MDPNTNEVEQTYEAPQVIDYGSIADSTFRKITTQPAFSNIPGL